jgi:hypothetical protein
MFGPQPPSAKAGVTADDTAVERMTSPNSAVEIFFIVISRPYATTEPNLSK